MNIICICIDFRYDMIFLRIFMNHVYYYYKTVLFLWHFIQHIIINMKINFIIRIDYDL